MIVKDWVEETVHDDEEFSNGNAQLNQTQQTVHSKKSHPPLPNLPKGVMAIAFSYLSFK